MTSLIDTSISLRRIFSSLGLVAVWCGLWGSVSAANILSGLLVAFFATSASLGTSYSGGVHLVSLIKFGALVSLDLVKSTIDVGREVLTPTDYTDEIIVAVEVPATTADHFLLLTIAITLTPGTAVVDADEERSILYLHLLHKDKAEETIEHVKRIAELANDALPLGEKGVRL